MCHEPQPARRKTDADATLTNQLVVAAIFCGKLSYCPASDPCGRRPKLRGTRQAPDFSQAEAAEIAAKNERPVRGDNRTGQAIWALGWMGARAEYSLDGEELPLPPLFVVGGQRHVQTALAIFPTFLAGVLDGKTIAPQGDWRCRQPICPTPGRPPARSEPGLGEFHAYPKHFRPRE